MRVLLLLSLRSVCFCLLALLTLGLIIGCQSSSYPVHPVVSASSLPAAQRSVPPSLTATRQVQALPLYQQAQAACQKQQYAQAASLLKQLAQSSDLSADEKEFCRQQQQICLDHLSPRPVSHASPSSAAARSPRSGSLVSSPASISAADCGPRALLLVCQQQGVKTSLAALTKAAGTSETGTSMEGLAKAAKAAGFAAEGVQLSREALAEMSPPALAWVQDERYPDGHYVAVLHVDGTGENATATLHDPNQTQEETISQEVLLRRSNGYLLLLRR